MIIYKWTNKINGKIYIGQSIKTLEQRIRAHVNTAKQRMIKDNGKQFKEMQKKGRKALEGKDPWNKGKKASPQAIKNQSLAHIGQAAWNKKAIICNETTEVFDSIHEAAKVYGLQPGHICNVLKGKRKSTGGKTFKYHIETTPPQ